jgi:hypothetical protein
LDGDSRAVSVERIADLRFVLRVRGGQDRAWAGDADLPAERRGSGLLLRPREEIWVSGHAARVWSCYGRFAVRRERRRGVRR